MVTETPQAFRIEGDELIAAAWEMTIPLPAALTPDDAWAKRYLGNDTFPSVPFVFAGRGCVVQRVYESAHNRCVGAAFTFANGSTVAFSARADEDGTYGTHLVSPGSFREMRCTPAEILALILEVTQREVA